MILPKALHKYRRTAWTNTIPVANYIARDIPKCIHLNSSGSIHTSRKIAVIAARQSDRPNRHFSSSSNGSPNNSHSSSNSSQNNSESSNRGKYERKNERTSSDRDRRNTVAAYYLSGLALAVFGVSYASVPLYKAFCAMTGFGGTTRRADEAQAIAVKPAKDGHLINIIFVSNVHSEMPWSFVPTQSHVKIIPGETALAFYTVKNLTNKTITGVATYNVHPPKSGLYFNKIQCFCFEEQRLGPGEEIDMPVFFYIDPDILTDPSMKDLSEIILSYTFFKTGEEESESIPEEELESKEPAPTANKTTIKVTT